MLLLKDSRGNCTNRLIYQLIQLPKLSPIQNIQSTSKPLAETCGDHCCIKIIQNQGFAWLCFISSWCNFTKLLFIHHHDTYPQHSNIILPNWLEWGDEPSPWGFRLRTCQREHIPCRLVVGLDTSGFVEENMVRCKAGAQVVGTSGQHMPLVFLR